MKMAKEEGWASNKKWQTMPETMLRYRAASFFSRAYCPDLTGGIHSVEELAESNMPERGIATNDEERDEQRIAVMEQLMNASGDDKKTPSQIPTPAPEAQEVERPRKQEPIEAEVEPQQPQNEPLTLTQAGTLPFDAAPTAAKLAPQTSQRSGLTSYEVLREEAQALMGPSGLNLNAEGKVKYLTKITGKSTVKELTMADLRAVINYAQARLEKMGAQRNDA